MGVVGHGLAQAGEAGAGADAQEGGAIDERRAVGAGGHEGDLGAGAALAKAALGRGRAVARAAMGVVFPPACLACGEPTEDAHGLCGTCWREAGFLAGAMVCDLCGAPLPGRDDGTAAHCDGCLAAPHPWDRGRAVLPYWGTGQVLALALKHGDRTDLAKPMGRWMARAARPLLEGVEGEAVLVPVPLHWTRLWGRRYNQAALLARAAGRALGLRVLPDAIVRRRRTAMLGHAGARERRATMSGALRLHPWRGRALEGRTVILVDDVLTTGATLGAATRVAREAGAASVRVLVLARASRGDEGGLAGEGGRAYLWRRG
jgi:ComF family protein